MWCACARPAEPCVQAQQSARGAPAVPGAQPHLRVAASGEVSFLDRAGALVTNLNGFFFRVERNLGIVGEQQEEQRGRRAEKEKRLRFHTPTILFVNLPLPTILQFHSLGRASTPTRACQAQLPTVVQLPDFCFGGFWAFRACTPTRAMHSLPAAKDAAAIQGEGERWSHSSPVTTLLTCRNHQSVNYGCIWFEE